MLPAAAADTAVTFASGSVSGFWRFNESLTRIDSYVCEPVSFECAGMTYASMNVYPGALRYALTTTDTGTSVASVNGTTLSFTSADYRLVYFGDSRQPVSSAFYKWLCANAAPYDPEASASFELDGSWYFDEDIEYNDWLYVLCDFVLVCDESAQFNTLYFDSDTLFYEGDSGMVTPWSVSEGWNMEEERSIAFLNGPVAVDEDTWRWFCCNAIQKRDPSSLEYYETSVQLGDDVFRFTLDESGSPDVTVTVTSTGATLSCGYRVKTWTYTGEGTFGGLYQSGGTTYLPGSSFTLSGASGRPVAYSLDAAFTDNTEDPEPDVFTLQAGQWEVNKLVMTGEYVDLTAWPDGLSSVDLSFSSAGSSFSSMTYQYNVASGYRLCYDSSYAYNYDSLSPSPAPAWQSDAYALVYLAADQTVPEDFYTWFTSNFTRSGDDPVAPSFSTTVNIYDASGLVLLHTVTFVGEDAAPVATLAVTQDGCTISCGDESTSWSAGDLAFYGFKLMAGSAGPSFVPGLPYTLPGGGSSDVVINLYVADTEGVSGDVGSVISGFFGLFIDPVMVFFKAEFVPGFSLGKICGLSLLLGLLFWFLHVSKS